MGHDKTIRNVKRIRVSYYFKCLVGELLSQKIVYLLDRWGLEMSSPLSDSLLRTENDAYVRRTKASEDLEDGSLYEHDSSYPTGLENGKAWKDVELPLELRSVNQGTSSFWEATTNTTGLLLGEWNQ